MNAVVARVPVVYEGGPIDGHVVEFVGLGKRRWARYTDRETGTKHFYELVWRQGHWAFAYRPEHGA